MWLKFIIFAWQCFACAFCDLYYRKTVQSVQFLLLVLSTNLYRLILHRPKTCQSSVFHAFQSVPPPLQAVAIHTVSSAAPVIMVGHQLSDTTRGEVYNLTLKYLACYNTVISMHQRSFLARRCHIYDVLTEYWRLIHRKCVHRPYYSHS